jgi:ubiquinone/menaquinone biosynthesis C-methylase UbiE
MSYSLPFAPFYDRLMADVPYLRWCDYLEKIWKKQKRPIHNVVDLACGTGEITVELAKRGYDMIGVDLSEEMLLYAKEKGQNAGQNILWLNQDIAQLDLYGTVDVAISSLDSINYIIDKRQLLQCFKRAHLFLEPDGLFIFDVNSPYKFEKVLGLNTFAYDCSDLYCVWQNYYDKKTHLCEFDITVFQKEGTGFLRYDEQQMERCYSVEELTNCLRRAGFVRISVYRPFTFRAPDAHSERIFFVAYKT